MSVVRADALAPFTLASPHGTLVGLPVDREATREALLARLHPEEAALASSWGDARVRTFVAGRLALRAALVELSTPAGEPILRSARGAPQLGSSVRASISHKDEVAVALAAVGTSACVGVDVEILSASRSDISRHVLTERERAELSSLDEGMRRRELLVRFSLKEALYKALDPYVQRYVGFLEVEVNPLDDGSAAFTLRLEKGEGAFDADGAWLIRGDVVITTAQVRPR